MTAISKTTFSNAFSWMKIYEFRLIYHIFVPKGRINNIPSLVQIVAWRQWGDKPLSEQMMVSLLTQICVTRSQWVKMPWWPIYVWVMWVIFHSGHGLWPVRYQAITWTMFICCQNNLKNKMIIEIRIKIWYIPLTKVLLKYHLTKISAILIKLQHGNRSLMYLMMKPNNKPHTHTTKYVRLYELFPTVRPTSSAPTQKVVF